MAESSPEVGLTVARPKIFVGGAEQESLAGSLLSLLIRESLDGLYRCEATFGNWGQTGQQTGFLHFKRDVLDFGKQFQVKLADEAIFDGRLMALEAFFPEGQAPEINVLAEDRFQDLRMTRRTRTFSDSSDSDVFNQIASDHGLTPNIDASTERHKLLAQVNQSDLAFMRERARATDVELWMDGANLNAKKHSGRGGTTLSMTYGRQLREFNVLADLAHQRTSVSVNGWDVSGKSALTYEATDAVISGEVGSDTSGVSILQSALGARKEALAHTVPLTSQQAQAEAEAYFRMCARRFVVGRGVAEKNAKLRAGNFVDLQGLGPLFSGKYYLVEVVHLFDGAHGMRTEFTAERPGIGQAQ